MPLEFHIFASEGDQVFTVRQEGIGESQEFSSLREATSHLRDHAEGDGGSVTIHDEDGRPNRIPLRLGS